MSNTMKENKMGTMPFNLTVMEMNNIGARLG